jgi:UDP-glucose:(glucosyl)LPS alpha-1,3-glucosyltransferase
LEAFLSPEEEIQLHVMTSVRDQDLTRARLEKLDNVSIYVIPSAIEELLSFDACLIKHVDSPTFYRLFLVEEVAKQVSRLERFVHIDLDMLCVGPWQELFTIDLESRLCAAVEDISINELFASQDPIFANYRQDLGFVDGDRYFNAGLLVIDVPIWRKEGITATATEFLRQHPGKLRYAEQTVLNSCLRGRWKPLPYGYNHQVANRPDYRGEVIIAHYVGSKKPWSCGPMNPKAWHDRRNLPLLDHPLYQAYWRAQEILNGMMYHHPPFVRSRLARLAKILGEIILRRKYDINCYREP